MKILHIMAYPPDYIGGYSIYCQNLIRNLNSHGLECEILTSNYNRISKSGEYYNSEGIRIINRRYYGNLFGINPLFNIIPFLNKHYRDYDIIHAHSYIFFSSIHAALLRKVRKFPLILQLHGGIQTDAFYTSNLFENFQLLVKKIIFDPVVGKFTLTIPDSLVSVSYMDLLTVLKRFKIKREKNYWIPNGVDLSKFIKIDDMEKKYITFIGRLSYIKGFDLFLKIAEKIYKKNQDIEFLVVGDGPLYYMLQDFKKQIPIRHYYRIPYEQMIKIYNQSKILLITSRYEGMPTTMLEAMACGINVIASNVGGIPEVIRNEDHGRLFKINNLSSVSEICLKSIENQKEGKSNSKKLREYLKKNFSWEIITKKMIRVYNDLIES